MSTKTFEVTTSNFETDVLKSQTPVLIDFWAEWCGPCRMIAPIVDQLADEFGDKLKIGKLDADEHQEVLMKYGIMSIPTLMLFKDGAVADTKVGAAPKTALASWIGGAVA